MDTLVAFARKLTDSMERDRVGKKSFNWLHVLSTLTSPTGGLEAVKAVLARPEIWLADRALCPRRLKLLRRGPRRLFGIILVVTLLCFAHWKSNINIRHSVQRPCKGTPMSPDALAAL